MPVQSRLPLFNHRKRGAAERENTGPIYLGGGERARGEGEDGIYFGRRDYSRERDASWWLSKNRESAIFIGFPINGKSRHGLSRARAEARHNITMSRRIERAGGERRMVNRFDTR